MGSVASWQVGPYVLSGDGILRLGGGVITLSPLQRKLLLCFVRHSGKLIERSQLVEEVWGHSKVSDVSLARAVHSLRQVLDQGPLGGRVISTTYGSGYVFATHVVKLEEPTPVVVSEIATPSPLALEYYLEARVASRHLDSAQLERSRKLLRLALQTSPSFCEAILFLTSLHLNCCRWGLEDSQSVGAIVEPLLNRAEQLNAPPEDLLPLRAEVISLLHWQPKLVDESFGSWLPDQLAYGLPLLSWVRHLMACGRAREGLALLESHLDGDLPMGWLLAAQLTFQLGQTEAAIEMLEAQLRMDGSLPATHLFLALLHAHRGERTAALQSLAAVGALSQGLQAVSAYVLARVGDTARAESLLHQAKAGGSATSGLASFWGLSAVVLGQPVMAEHFFQLAVQRRCYQAPFLAQSPLLGPYASEASVKTFQRQMVRFFPTLLSPAAAPSKPVGALARP